MSMQAFIDENNIDLKAELEEFDVEVEIEALLEAANETNSTDDGNSTDGNVTEDTNSTSNETTDSNSTDVLLDETDNSLNETEASNDTEEAEETEEEVEVEVIIPVFKVNVNTAVLNEQQLKKLAKEQRTAKAFEPPPPIPPPKFEAKAGEVSQTGEFELLFSSPAVVFGNGKLPGNEIL